MKLENTTGEPRACGGVLPVEGGPALGRRRLRLQELLPAVERGLGGRRVHARRGRPARTRACALSDAEILIMILEILWQPVATKVDIQIYIS